MKHDSEYVWDDDPLVERFYWPHVAQLAERGLFTWQPWWSFPA